MIYRRIATFITADDTHFQRRKDHVVLTRRIIEMEDVLRISVSLVEAKVHFIMDLFATKRYRVMIA